MAAAVVYALTRSPEKYTKPRDVNLFDCDVEIEH